MQVREACNACDAFVETRVVLHRARTEWIHADVDRVIPRRHANEVAHNVHFADFRHAPEIVVALKLLRNQLRSEEHTSELQSPCNLVCRLLLEKKKHTIQRLLLTRHQLTATASR